MASPPKSTRAVKTKIERKPEALAKSGKAWDSGGSPKATRSANLSVYIWAALGVLALGYFAYSYYWPMTTTPMVIKQTTPPATPPVAPAVTPPAASTPPVATPPATTTAP